MRRAFLKAFYRWKNESGQWLARRLVPEHPLVTNWPGRDSGSVYKVHRKVLPIMGLYTPPARLRLLNILVREGLFSSAGVDQYRTGAVPSALSQTPVLPVRGTHHLCPAPGRALEAQSERPLPSNRPNSNLAPSWAHQHPGSEHLHLERAPA